MSRTLSVNALILASATVCVGVCAELTAQDPPSEASPKVEYVAITGGTVHIGTGQLMQGATVLLANDKIERVGQGIHIPEGATVKSPLRNDTARETYSCDILPFPDWLS